MIHGHGIVWGYPRGPASPGGSAQQTKTPVRRFQCQACDAVIRVVQACATARKHFTGAAIASALALWGLCGLSAGQVRKLVNDRQTDGEAGWTSLSRWADGIVGGTLFPELGLRGIAGSALAVAAKAASILCGWAPPAAREAPREHQAFAGACRVS